MILATRRLLDRSFTLFCCLSILLMAAALVILLGPIFVRGAGAFLFRETVEQRVMAHRLFQRGEAGEIAAERAAAAEARRPVYEAIERYEPEVRATVDHLNRAFEKGSAALADEAVRARAMGEIQSAFDSYLATLREELIRLQTQAKANAAAATGLAELEAKIREVDGLRAPLLEKGSQALLDAMPPRRAALLESDLGTVQSLLTRPLDRLKAFQERVRDLLGPLPGDPPGYLERQFYGQTRWDRALVKFDELLHTEEWVRPEGGSELVKERRPRRALFAGTSFEPVFDYLTAANLERMLRPRLTFYWRFLTDVSYDAHLYGGIYAEVLGTIYLTLGAMLFAVPFGIIAAIYLAEYARDGWLVSLLRSCISTLAGVPSIVFGLFGLAFFINTIRLSDNKSVIAGAVTLALLILPTIIRAAEEAILAVPHSYKEAAMGLGASRWHTVLTVILPAALPGILTGIVISMGRAAGETAPIIFTAAVSMGTAVGPGEVLEKPTPALPWNIYNLCTENEVVNEIRHVQYGMVTTLVAIVLCLNVAAIVLRARVAKKLRG